MSISRQAGRPVRLTGTVHKDLQTLTLRLSVEHGRRIALTEVVSAALEVAQRHADEMSAELTKVEKGQS